MKVKELIEKLNKFNQELEVTACYEGDNILDGNVNITNIALISTMKENEKDYLVLMHE